jgi:glycosyltransferase involved in cell wall biosynthesis
MQPAIDIIIPFKEVDQFLIESVQYCIHLDYDDYRIILLPDEAIMLPLKSGRIVIIPTGNVPVAVKRNIGVRYSRGHARYLAFLDSDSFPHTDWLKKAVVYFADRQIAAVGGPNVSPDNEELRRIISGYVYESKMAFGGGAMRHKVSGTRFRDELPTCNLVIRKKIFEELRFDENFQAAEDLKLCREIIGKGHKILFAKDVQVWHHRRKIFVPVLKQVYFYGYFRAKLEYGDCKVKIVFLPMLFLIYCLLCILGILLNPGLSTYFLAPICVYLTVNFLNSVFHIKSLPAVFLTVFVIMICHLSYGSGFLIFHTDRLMSIIAGKTRWNEMLREIRVPVNQ